MHAGNRGPRQPPRRLPLPPATFQRRPKLPAHALRHVRSGVTGPRVPLARSQSQSGAPAARGGPSRPLTRRRARAAARPPPRPSRRVSRRRRRSDRPPARLPRRPRLRLRLGSPSAVPSSGRSGAGEAGKTPPPPSLLLSLPSPGQVRQHGERLVPHLQPSGEDDIQRQGLQVGAAATPPAPSAAPPPPPRRRSRRPRAPRRPAPHGRLRAGSGPGAAADRAAAGARRRGGLRRPAGPGLCPPRCLSRWERPPLRGWARICCSPGQKVPGRGAPLLAAWEGRDTAVPGKPRPPRVVGQRSQATGRSRAAVRLLDRVGLGRAGG